MPGYVTCMGRCLCCGVLFSFNPVRVPSIPVNGEREPVCRGCVERANPLRVAKGLKPFEVHEDAYTGCRGRASRGARLRVHKAWRACERLDARLMCEIGTGL